MSLLPKPDENQRKAVPPTKKHYASGLIQNDVSVAKTEGMIEYKNYPDFDFLYKKITGVSPSMQKEDIKKKSKKFAITMGKVKYSEKMKEQTVKYILEGDKSATKVSKELGIDTNTVCRWVREYRTAHEMPTMRLKEK